MIRTMKAVRFHAYGDSTVLRYEENVAVLSLQSDEILIKIHCAGVSPFDVHVREGWYIELKN